MIIFTILKLYVALFLVLLVPGYFLAKAILARQEEEISAIEKLVIVFALSIFSVDFLVIFLDFLGLPLTRITIFIIIAIFSAVCFFVYKKRAGCERSKNSSGKKDVSFATLRNISYRQILIFLVILMLAVLVRGLYLSRGIMPQTTDLGHHMYWAKVIRDTGALPSYGMPDFIIGEHIIFGAMAIISGISFISAMPVIVLLLVNIFSLFALAILAYRICNNFTSAFNAKAISFMTFLIAGSLYAVSSPQSKFISGGVVGNVIGNLFIPLTLYFFLIAAEKRSKNFAMLFLLAGAALAYTHHLSSFVFLYVFSGFVLVSVVAILVFFRANIRRTFGAIAQIARPFLSMQNLVVVFVILLFLLFVHPLSYLNSSAIETAVGVPIKETRTGLALGSVIASAGPWRFFYAILGMAVLGVIMVTGFFNGRKKDPGKPVFSVQAILSVVLASVWLVGIYLMSTHPALLRVDIPSSRIVSYITYPATILSAIGAVTILTHAQKKYSGYVFALLFVAIMGTGFVSGFSDISDSARDGDGSNEKTVAQTYLAVQYLEPIVENDEMVLKDHVNLPGDAWIKLYFMKGYKYPLSRAILRRYDDPANKRETCTRDMIAIPDSEIGKACFRETSVKYIMLENGSENAQFDRSVDFSRIYASDDAVIYMRK